MNRYSGDTEGVLPAWLIGRGAIPIRVDDGITLYYWRAGADAAAILADAKELRLPPSTPAYLSLGEQFAAVGDFETAARYFAQALEHKKSAEEAAMVNVAWGDAARRTGDWNGAAQKYRTALAADANRVTAWTGLGRVYLEQNQLPAAKDMLIHALALEPDSYAALFFLADVYQRIGQTATAQEYYDRAASIYP